MSQRVLIVNADDFGRSPGVNRGVIRAHEEGIVTSATLMVRWPAAEEAADYARRRDSLSVGLHLDLGEWVYRDGDWHTRYQVVPNTPDSVAAELSRQLERLERLIGRAPTHLDSHQHVHRYEPARTALLKAGERLGIPVRRFTPGIAYSGVFHGQDAGRPLPGAITVEALVDVIETLPSGVTELACHPAAQHDHDSDYGEERIQELETLCDPRVRAAIDASGVDLRSFGDLER